MVKYVHMSKERISEKLHQLLSKSTQHYKHHLIKNSIQFDFKKPTVLFGAAKLAHEYIEFFKKKGTPIVALSDNNTALHGKKMDGIRILSKNEIKKTYGHDVQIVATSLYYLEIIKDIHSMGFKKLFSPLYFSTLYSKDFDVLVWKNDIKLILQNKKKIQEAFALLSDNHSRMIFLRILQFRLLLDEKVLKNIQTRGSEYFDKKLIHLAKDEVFLDGGGYDGDTIKMIIKHTQNRFKDIYSFEPDSANFKKLAAYVKQLNDPRIQVFKLGVGNKKGVLHFTNEGNLQSKIIKKGKKMVKVVPIDAFSDAQFTYIKRDIEGFEKKALLGAKKTIQKGKPKLIVCVYHHAYDLWELPILIKRLRPDYKVHLRHYSDFILETICYAT